MPFSGQKIGRPKGISAEEAAVEILKRRKARTSVVSFSEYTHPQWTTGAHHKIICEHLEALERRDIERLMIHAPPRHSKSELASRRFPAWYFGRHPENQILLTSYGDEIAEDLSRSVRNIMRDLYFHALFPDVVLATDTTAAGRWETTAGGIFVAVGIGGAATGRGAHLGIIDDPLKGRADADSPRTRQVIWEWYHGVFRTRLMKNSCQLLMMCMTGDTPVLMAGGEEKPLARIRPGDMIATYADGRAVVSVVKNWKPQGVDCVFTIKMTSGIVVRANARHPFLVCEDSEEKWRRTEFLKKGDIIRRVIGVSGTGLPAPKKGVESPPELPEGACHTTARPGGQPGSDRHQRAPWVGGMAGLSAGMALILRSMTAWLLHKVGFAAYAESRRQKRTLARTGTENSASTTTTPAGKYAASCATTAILRSATEKPSVCCELPLSTCDDTIADVFECGVADVFDIEVEGTHNFIANGLVVSNTRWHEDDLAGRLLETEGKYWSVLNLEGIADEGTDHEKALWPEMYSYEVLSALRRDLSAAGRLREWKAQYQQKPTAEEGIFIKREWMSQRYEQKPEKMNVYMASDFAVTEAAENRDPDWTVHGVFGIDAANKIHVLDWWRGRTSPDVWIDTLIDMLLRWKPRTWFGEKGPIRRSIETFLTKRMLERNCYSNMEWIASVADKAARARSLQALASMGRITWPKGQSWVDEVVEVVVGFPTVKHDDDFDVLALMCLAIDEAYPAVVGSIAPKKKVDPWQHHRATPTSRWKTA